MDLLTWCENSPKYPFPLYFLVFSFFHANSKCLQGYIDDKYLCYSTLNWSTAAASNSIRTAMISHWTFQNIKKSLLCFGLFNKAQSFAPEVDSTLTTLNICRLQTWWFLSISRPSDSGPLEHQLRFSWNNNFFFCYDEVRSDQMDKLGLVVDQGEGLVLKAGRGKYSLICWNTMYNDGHTGRMVLQKRMNFRKNSNRPLTPPPLIFGKSCCGFRDKSAYVQYGGTVVDYISYFPWDACSTTV